MIIFFRIVGAINNAIKRAQVVPVLAADRHWRRMRLGVRRRITSTVRRACGRATRRSRSVILDRVVSRDVLMLNGKEISRVPLQSPPNC